jgi:electron transport complex protein RnfB
MTGRAVANGLVDAIDALLPQTQCRRCGYPACRPYAAAVADGEAINRCPPGGAQTILALGALLDRPAIPLAAELAPAVDAIARIDEARCIGCALCLPACPVDAIVGAALHMHTVVARHCTGCELCVPTCPVDCITMLPTVAPGTPDPTAVLARAASARVRYQRHARIEARRARAAELRRQRRRATPRAWDDS